MNSNIPNKNNLLKPTLFCIFFYSLIFSFHIYAQNTGHTMIINAGANSSKIKYIENLWSKSLLGPSVGIYYEHPFYKKWNYSFGMEYNMNGYKEADSYFDEANNPISLISKANYLTIPIQIHFYPFTNNGLELTAGILQNFLLKRNFYFKPQPEFNIPHGKSNIYDITFSFGAAYNLYNFRLGVNYRLGMCNGFKEGKGFKNRYWNITLGYKIPIRKK